MKNILLILTDQQRKDSLGCYGNPVCQTPNLDRLAASGIRFNRNYVANPICMPSRVCIFTGKNIRNHGLWTNGLLVKEQDTIAGHFSKNGYNTATVGKLHFTPHGSPGENNMEYGENWGNGTYSTDWHGPYWGFNHVELLMGQCAPVAHYGEWFFKNGGTKEMLTKHPTKYDPKTSVMKMPLELHPCAFIAEKSIEFMKKSKDNGKPFFTVASFQDPHAPFNPPEEMAEKYSTKDVVMPKGDKEGLESRPKHYINHFKGEWDRSYGGRKKPKHPDGISESVTRERIAKTYAMIDLVDQNVGKMLNFLEDQGLRDDTIVVFSSDHGELLGDYGLWSKGPFYYDCLMNTALLISCPALIKPGVSDTIFSDLDIAPTLCDMAGIEQMPFMDGISQLPHMLDNKKEVRDRCLIEYRNGYGEKDISSKALVKKDYKYIRYQTGEEELTHLSKDPEERDNVAQKPEYSEIKEQLKTELLDEILKTEQKGPEQLSHA